MKLLKLLLQPLLWCMFLHLQIFSRTLSSADSIRQLQSEQLQHANNNHIDHTQDRHAHSKSNLYHKHVMKRGVVGLIPVFSVHGAIIVSDLGKSHHTNQSSNENGADSTLPTKLQITAARVHNVKRLEAQLPFELTHWPPVFTSPCPIHPANVHKSERGLVWAHYRIWKEFIYFDQDLLEAVAASSNVTERTEPIVSKDGVYAVHPNGTLFKDGLPFRDRDILVIFEDDADSTIRRLNYTLQEEFSHMTSDLLYLGWCDGRLARPVPLCSHAYAVTRSGARKLVQNLEPCGKAVDEQFVILAKNNFITWRKVAPSSYSNTNKRYPVHGDKTFGIFHQNKWELGSYLGH